MSNELTTTENEEISTTVNEDFEYSRGHIIKVIEVADKAIDELSLIAEQAQTNARLYEVLSNLLNTKLAASKDLLNSHKSKKENMEAVNETNTRIGTQQNILFTGSPADLQEFLKNQKSKVIDHDPEK